MEPTDEKIRNALHDMIDVLTPTQLHAMYLVCAKLFIAWTEKK
jgi:hypothetical protein